MAELRWYDDEVRGQLRSKTERGLLKLGAAVEQRAKQLVPVLTGNLQRTIRYEGPFRDARGRPFVLVLAGGVSGVGYAIYVELGTVRMRAQPYLLPALRQVRGRAGAIMRAA